MKSSRLLQTLSAAANSPRIIFLVAFGARLWVLSQLLPANAWSDFYKFNEPSHIAWSLLSGFGYSSPWTNTLLMRTAQQPPVYPFLLAGIFKLAGTYSYRALWIALGLNALFSSITAVVILQLGKRTFDGSTGVLAAWIWSCWIYEAVVSVRLWESSLSALLLAVSLLLLTKMSASIHPRDRLLLGAVAGVGGLTNATLLAVFPFFWLWLWISYRRRRLSCGKWLATSVTVCVLVMLPWTVRNYATFHRLVPVRDNFGLELWLGNHEGVTQVFDNDFPILNPTEYNRLGEIRFMEVKREIALDFIRQHPMQFLRLSIHRFFRFWGAPEKWFWWPLSLLAWGGMVLALLRKRWESVPYAAVILIFPLVYYLTHVFGTFRHPIEPVMLILASYGMVSVVSAVGPHLFRHIRSETS